MMNRREKRTHKLPRTFGAPAIRCANTDTGKDSPAGRRRTSLAARCAARSSKVRRRACQQQPESSLANVGTSQASPSCQVRQNEFEQSWRASVRGGDTPRPPASGGLAGALPPGGAFLPPPLHEAAGLVAARRRKPSLSRHHASREAPTVGRRSVVVRDDGTNDASQKLGARGATAREIALTSEFTSKTLTFDGSKLRPRRATRAEKRCVRKPRAERTNFPELARELGRRDAQ